MSAFWVAQVASNLQPCHLRVTRLNYRTFHLIIDWYGEVIIVTSFQFTNFNSKASYYNRLAQLIRYNSYTALRVNWYNSKAPD